MNKNALLLLVGSLLIAGCSSALYTRRPAPIVNMDTVIAPNYQGAQTTQFAPVEPQRSLLTPVRPQEVPAAKPEMVVKSSGVYQPLIPATTNAGEGAPQSQEASDGWSAQPGATITGTEAQNSAAEALRPGSHPQGEDAATPVTTPQATSSTVPSLPTAEKSADHSQSSAVALPVNELLKRASASLGKGDLESAAAYLENAQRIDSHNGKILYDLANIRYHQGRYKDAETFAGRAVQVGGSNALLKKSWAMIANARTKLGDNQGAVLAAEKAASY